MFQRGSGTLKSAAIKFIKSTNYQAFGLYVKCVDKSFTFEMKPIAFFLQKKRKAMLVYHYNYFVERTQKLAEGIYHKYNKLRVKIIFTKDDSKRQINRYFIFGDFFVDNEKERK